MIETIGGIGAVSAVRGVDAAMMTLTGAPASQRGAARRDRRLKWLASVREALGEAAPLVDEMAAEEGGFAEVSETRSRIAEALGLVDQVQRLMGHPSENEDDMSAPSGRTITATALARRISSAAEQSLRVQAQIGPAAVRRLVGEGR